MDVAPSPGRAAELTLERSTTTSGNLVLSWAASCLPSASNYAIYEGTLGNYYSHTMKDCSDDGTPLSEEISPSAGSAYYLVVPFSASAEGSYGKDSEDRERPVGAAVCVTAHAVADCP